MALLTLLTTTGRVHRTAGLNWGSNTRNHTTPYDAYIPLHLATLRRHPDLFLPKNEIQTILTFTWDDGTEMTGLFEGNNPDPIRNLMYPKQIASTPHKRTLGQYFRSRLGVSEGHFITLDDLNRYGRTTVDMVSIGHNHYHFDFSV